MPSEELFLEPPAAALAHFSLQGQPGTQWVAANVGVPTFPEPDVFPSPLQAPPLYASLHASPRGKEVSPGTHSHSLQIPVSVHPWGEAWCVTAFGPVGM